MAQNISLMNADYPDVPAVTLPKTGGGTATFTDVSDTTATASDVLNSKYFYNASGEKVQGTATGGGTPAISVVDTADSAGGVVRTITALDISDTTAVASDVASGKYFYTADGTKTQGSASGGGVDCPTFTVVLNQSMTAVDSITCDKTYSECYAYRNDGVYYAVVDLSIGSTTHFVTSASNNYENSTLIYYVEYTGAGVADLKIQYTSSTLTATIDPIPWNDSNDLTASNLTVTAPSGYYHSSASKTLTDANLVAGNIKNGVSIFGVLGTFAGGGGGLVYEKGSYTPSSDVAHPTISFANSHTTSPCFIALVENSQSVVSSSSSAVYWTFVDWYSALGKYVCGTSSTSYRYARVNYAYKSSNSISESGATITSLTGSTTTALEYYVDSSSFKPYLGNTSRYFRSGKTYEWIAVWKPTT